jgi:hypothetical protein
MPIPVVPLEPPGVEAPPTMTVLVVALLPPTLEAPLDAAVALTPPLLVTLLDTGAIVPTVLAPLDASPAVPSVVDACSVVLGLELPHAKMANAHARLAIRWLAGQGIPPSEREISYG